MEELLFNSYRAYHKEKHKVTVRKIMGMPKAALFFICVAFLGFISTYVLLCNEKFCKYWLVCVGVECLSVVALYFYSEAYQIKISNSKLESLSCYYKDLYEWFNTKGFWGSRSILIELKERIIKQIECAESMLDKRHNTIMHLFDVIIIPVLLAIFANVIHNETKIEELVGYAINLFGFLISFLVFGWLVCEMFSFHKKRKIEQIKCFASDLQGIIDTQFEDKLISYEQGSGKE